MTKAVDRVRISLWPNSLLMFALFMTHVITLHRLTSLGVAPVGTDPCDGVNAYAFIAIVFISIVSILRIVAGANSLSSAKYLHNVRSQQAVLYAIFITFASEIVALARNAATWDRNVSPGWLFALLTALAAFAVCMQLLIFLRQRKRISLSHLRWTHTILPVVAALTVLGFCPEWPTYSPSITAHILTVTVGAFVVFGPMRLLLSQIVLTGHDEYEKSAVGFLRGSIPLVSGVGVALFAFFRHVPFFIVDIAQLFIAYAILRKPLQLDNWREGPIQIARTSG